MNFGEYVPSINCNVSQRAAEFRQIALLKGTVACVLASYVPKCFIHIQHSVHAKLNLQLNQRPALPEPPAL